MDWKSAKLPAGGKLFKVYNFNFLYQGVNYLLEVDEYADGAFSGHAEHATDHNYVIESVSGKSVADCISGLCSRIEARSE
jgi:hypothetical protein